MHGFDNGELSFTNTILLRIFHRSPAMKPPLCLSRHIGGLSFAEPLPSAVVAAACNGASLVDALQMIT